MRRIGEGITDYGNYILHYKGETLGQYGVGFLIKKNLAHRIEEIKGISERITILNITLPLYKEEKWSIIQAYSPTESDKKEDISKINKFYEDLRFSMQNCNKNIIVMGDFNAQVGIRNNSGEEYTVGKYGQGKRSKNGSRLVTFALENKLKILNSFYKKKETKRWTWMSPNGIHKNEIDFIMSNNPKYIKDISIIHNLNFNSDHKMVRAKLTGTKIKTKRQFRTDNISIVCTGNTTQLMNNLQKVTNKEAMNQLPIQEQYAELINLLKTETKKVNTESKKVISDETYQLLKERQELLQRKEKKINRSKISELSKKINLNIRKDKKIKRQNTLKKHIEKTGGIKKAIKELNSKKDWMLKVKTMNNNYTNKRTEIMKVATEYYRNLYQTKNPKRIISKINTDCESIPRILKEETIRAINTQKKDKTPGADQVTNELLKSTAPVIAPILTDIFNKIIDTEVIPEDWTKSTIILLHKKGDKGDIGNYRPISLMSNVYKVFSKIILSRITSSLDENQPKEQAGFRSKYSTIDHIHILRQILQKYNEYNKTYYLGFVDYNKAFDSLEHDYIWEALRIQGIRGKYIKILQSIYSKSTARVRLETTGEEFPIERGVRQGDPISPKLFSAALEIIFRNLQWDHEGLNINGVKLNHLRFADDLILFSECPKQLEQMLQQLSDQSAKAGLTMNTAKTKIMTNTSQTYNITVNAQKIEYVEEYVYLGQLIAARNTMHKEIERRIANTWKRYWSLSEVMKNEDMPLKEKRRVYNMCILPCLTYGCQTWALTENLMNKINVCQNGIERSVIGVKRMDKIRLEEIKNVTKFKEAKKDMQDFKMEMDRTHAKREK
ncbi:unnamed protein product [Euphydryas editha]|uniref:Reverse transcriptase domain-containing protein n=1 Tax=Euphydryas editha TaxID=104508 RepID=A0AAU9UDD4_EUPED|nr:unnamed protein product [Euphydryas editha]